MPLSPEMRTKLIEHTGADASVSEDALLSAVITELDARKVDLSKAVEKTLSLSTDNERLTGELNAAQAAVEAKSAEVLALSADTKAPDPLVLSMYAETFEAKAESAIEAGAPKAAVDYFAGLVKAADGTPNVLALSACSVPAGDKSKQSRLGIAIMDGLAKLAKGGFGSGVQTGIATLQASTDDDKEKPVSEERKKELLALVGISAK